MGCSSWLDISIDRINGVETHSGGCDLIQHLNAGTGDGLAQAHYITGHQHGVAVVICGGVALEAEDAPVDFALTVEADELHLAVQQFGATGQVDRLHQGRPLRQRHGAWISDTSADVHLHELRCEVCLASFEQLFTQHLRALGHAHHISVEEADVLAFIAGGDQREEIEVGADATTAGTGGLATGHLHFGEVGEGGDALGSTDCVEHGGELQAKGAEAASTGYRRGTSGDLIQAAARRSWGRQAIQGGLLGGFRNTLKFIVFTEGVVPGTFDLTAHVHANGPIADWTDVHLRIAHVGAELLGKEQPQLLNREAFHVEGSQPRQVDGSVWADDDPAAEFRQIQQLNVQSITGAEDVGIKADATALFTGEAGSLTGFRRFRLSSQRQRCQHQAGCECSDGQPGPKHVLCSDKREAMA